MRYYYAILQDDEFGNKICSGTIDTFAEINNEGYMQVVQPTEDNVGKMWTGTEWVDNPNPPPDSNSELKADPTEEAVDDYTLELIEGGLLL